MATLNVPSQYSTINAAAGAASSGDTIQLAAGTITETSLTEIPAGVSLRGAGAGVTTIRFSGGAAFTNHIPASGPSDCGGIYKQLQAVGIRFGNHAASNVGISSQTDMNNAQINGFTIDGNNRLLYSGLLFKNVKDFDVYDIEVINCFCCGVRFSGASEFTFDDYAIRNCSWGCFGVYRLAGMLIHCIEDGVISNGVHEEPDEVSFTQGGQTWTAGGGGGITTKESNGDYDPNLTYGGSHDPLYYVKDVTFQNLDFQGVYFQSPWGGGTGNLDLELHNALCENVLITGCSFYNTLSLIQDDGQLASPTGDYQIRVIGNTFETNYSGSFPIEMGHSHTEFACNVIRAGGSGPMFADFHPSGGGSEQQLQNISIHSNYMYGWVGGYAETVLYISGGINKLWFFNNTVDFGGRNVGLFYQRFGGTTQEFNCFNNIFTEGGGNLAWGDGSGTVTTINLTNNRYYNANSSIYSNISGIGVGSTNESGRSTGSPSFAGGSQIPNKWFIQSGSNAENGGVAQTTNSPYGTLNTCRGISGGTPDLGAYELGATQSCGLTSGTATVSACDTPTAGNVTISGTINYFGDPPDPEVTPWTISVNGSTVGVTGEQFVNAPGQVSYQFIYPGNDLPNASIQFNPGGGCQTLTLVRTIPDCNVGGTCSIVGIENGQTVCSGGTYDQTILVGWSNAPTNSIDIFYRKAGQAVFTSANFVLSGSLTTGSENVVLAGLECDTSYDVYVTFSSSSCTSPTINFPTPSSSADPCEVTLAQVVPLGCGLNGAPNGQTYVQIEYGYQNLSGNIIRVEIDGNVYASITASQNSASGLTFQFAYPCDNGVPHDIRLYDAGDSACTTPTLQFVATSNCQLTAGTPVVAQCTNNQVQVILPFQYTNAPAGVVNAYVGNNLIGSVAISAGNGSASIIANRACTGAAETANLVLE